MKPIVVIREIRPDDRLKCGELVKDYVMSFANDAFLSCLFRELTIQLIVIVWAILFIFFGVPLLFCLFAVPCIVGLMYFSVYGMHYNKAIELSHENTKDKCWIAEAYQPYFLRCDPKDIEYDIYSEERLQSLLAADASALNRLQKLIVGTISLKCHHSRDNAGWIYRMAVHPKYSMDRIGDPLTRCVLQFCYQLGYYDVETCTTECQFNVREMWLRMGFTMKQVYHKQIIGTVNIMKSQLGINLAKWSDSNAKYPSEKHPQL